MLRHKTIRARFVVHPHIRGGTPPVVTVRVYLPRFIPTHVGNTSENSIRVIVVPVHPHTRGEHLCEHVRHPGRGGSSPHTWGTRAIGGAIPKVTRFIPTHVGNTGTTSTRPATPSVHPHTRGEHRKLERPPPCAVTVHPHTRGEHRKTRTVIPKLFGSSPHTWGTLRSMIRWPVRDRFIPTHVGNTQRLPLGEGGSSVHPHTRGEHEFRETRIENWYGSSPHTWGTPKVAASLGKYGRFIPTHVGNTQGGRGRSGRRPVHPHTRGEHDDLLQILAGRAGSSPHTWGTRALRRPPGPLRRFIPTHVGNTPTCGRSA